VLRLSMAPLQGVHHHGFNGDIGTLCPTLSKIQRDARWIRSKRYSIEFQSGLLAIGSRYFLKAENRSNPLPLN
jgi:hypothetical protein